MRRGRRKAPARPPDGGRAGASVVATDRSGGDQWWPWPLVISWYSSAVGLGIWFPSP